MPKDNHKKNNKEATNQPLQEGRDFYVEDGRFVLTEYYLRNRGYCCGNGCRHCPYFKEGGRRKEEGGMKE